MTDQLTAFLKQNPNIKTLWVDQNFNYVTCPCVGYQEIKVTELLGISEEPPGEPEPTEVDPPTDDKPAAEEPPGEPKETKGKRK